MKKLAASLRGTVGLAPSISTFAQKLASRVEPGQMIEFADGSRRRVLGKSASATGVRLVLARVGGQDVVDIEKFSALGPVSPAMRRLASFVHRVLAYDAQLDEYVKTAIRDAGLPVDNTINWSKFLYRIYTPLLLPLTKDPNLIDEAIHDVVITELFQMRILQKDSQYAHFDANHPSLAGKEEANKVSAYLTSIFLNRKEDVINHVKRQLGVGAQGNIGLLSTESLDAGNDDEDGEMTNDFGSIIAPEENHDIEELEGQDEVHKFLSDFQAYIAESNNEKTAKTLNFITRAFESGKDKKEIQHLVVGNPELAGRSGKPLDRDSWNFAIAQWARSLRSFVDDPAEGWSDRPIAQMLAKELSAAAQASEARGEAQKQRNEEKKKKQQTVASSLRLAAFEPEEQQPAAAVPVAPPAPPPPNPNVQQQNAISQSRNMNGLNTAPAAPAVQENGQQPVPPKTIEPEIPGVNHTASSEPAMPKVNPPIVSRRVSAESRVAARRVAQKFSRLRQIANEEPQEVGAALSDLKVSFLSLSKKLANLEDHLDVTTLPKEATIRQKVAHRNTFARGLKVLAAEEPQELENALNDFYAELNSVVGEVETLADNLGVDLTIPEDGPIDSIEFPPTSEDPAEETDVAEEEVKPEGDFVSDEPAEEEHLEGI
jgi:hypothetical protein